MLKKGMKDRIQLENLVHRATAYYNPYNQDYLSSYASAKCQRGPLSDELQASSK